MRRVTQSGALPVSRDAPGYAAVLRLLGVADAGTNGGDEHGATLNGEAARAGETRRCLRGAMCERNERARGLQVPCVTGGWHRRICVVSTNELQKFQERGSYARHCCLYHYCWQRIIVIDKFGRGMYKSTYSFYVHIPRRYCNKQGWLEKNAPTPPCTSANIHTSDHQFLLVVLAKLCLDGVREQDLSGWRGLGVRSKVG